MGSSPYPKHYGHTQKLMQELEQEPLQVEAVPPEHCTCQELSDIGLDLLWECIKENPTPELMSWIGIHRVLLQNKRPLSILQKQGCTVLESYSCKSFDTYGPFEIIGGMAEGHPDAGEIAGAVFFEGIYEQITIEEVLDNENTRRYCGSYD